MKNEHVSIGWHIGKLFAKTHLGRVVIGYFLLVKLVMLCENSNVMNNWTFVR